MKVMLLGAPRGLSENRWKDDIAEAGQQLGWDVTHWESRGAPVDDVVRASKGADLFVWARTHGHLPDGDPHTMLRRIEDLGVPTVGIHMDLYWGIRHRQDTIGREPWWTCQHVFTADGGDRDWVGRGVNHHWLPPAIGPRFFGRATPTGKYRRARVAFIGAHVPNIHGAHRQRLIAWAERTYPGRFAHFDGRRASLWGEGLSDLYASAHVILGDSAPAGRYWSDRIPMTLGRGGVLAYPRTPGLEEWGFTDENMLFYDRFGFKNLGEQIAELTPQRRRDMSDAALTLIGERHMWSHRLQYIQKVVLG